MTCGCCLEACPQFTKLEVVKLTGEIEEQCQQRKVESLDEYFLGAVAMSQAILFNEHPTGHMNAGERLEDLMGPGGLQSCGNTQNCVAVCPKEIPLTTSIARAGRQIVQTVV